MSNLVLGRGKVYFDRFIPGTTIKTGERYMGATPSFSVSAETQELDHFSSEEGLQIKDESVTLRVDYSGALTVEDMSGANTALFFFGESETTTIAAAADEQDVFVAQPGLVYQLGASDAKPEGVEQVSAITVTGNGGAPVYAEGADYIAHLEEGFIEIVPGGAIVADTPIEVNYSVAAQTQNRVISGSTLIQGALRFRSRNGVGQQRNFYMPKVTLRPNGEFALKGEEWQNISFNVEILKAGNLANLFTSGRAVAV
ncbi:hypothetical protein ACM25O_13120 [Sulfitobacter pontiacus]